MFRFTVIVIFTAFIGTMCRVVDNLKPGSINLDSIKLDLENIKSDLENIKSDPGNTKPDLDAIKKEVNSLKPNNISVDNLKPELDKIQPTEIIDDIKDDISLIDAIKEDIFKIVNKISIKVDRLPEKPVDPNDVTYYLYTKKNPNDYKQLKENNLNLLNNRKVVFFIHGWINNKNVGWYENLTNAFLINYDYDVIQVDWSKPAFHIYSFSSINTRDIGKIIAELIVNLNKNHGVKLNDVLLIGHSLGAQTTGYVGKNIYKLTGEKLPRIIALDPAGPIFSERPEEDRLNPNDAKIVEVVHSDGGTFGFEKATGTIDFFPNGGNSQPGCDEINLKNIVIGNYIGCDHSRSYEYFIEAILHPEEFEAQKCTNWTSYQKGNCTNGELITLGNLTINATGNFYLETNRDKPFAKIK